MRTEPGGGARSPVVAVVVTYRPDAATLARVLAAAAPQVAGVVIVDNSADGGDVAARAAAALAHVRLVRMSDNRGVAAAQNAGIREARALGAAFVLLLDQDSVCAPGMVARLLAAVQDRARSGAAVSAVGPRYREGDGVLSGFVRFGTIRFRRVPCPADRDGVVEADFLISSGSLIPMAAVDRVGMMDESLFIDHVDTEWFLRARAHGLRCFGVCDAVMDHALGEGRARVWLGRWRHVPRHRPFRYYYMVRNSVLLYRRAYAPRRWIAADLLRLAGMTVANIAMAGPRAERLRMMARGLRDGITGRHGPLTAAP